MELTCFVLAALFQLTLSAPNPDDIHIDVKQDVNAGGCCPGSCCNDDLVIVLLGCTWGDTSYPSGSYLNMNPWNDCAKLMCNDGVWEIQGENNCPGEECKCQYVQGMDDDGNGVEKGCILGEPNLPWMACNCTLYEEIIGGVPPTIISWCSGSIVDCVPLLPVPPINYYCKNTGTGLGFCLQGGGGNCNGYSIDNPKQ